MDKEQRAKIHQEMMQRKSHPYADIKGKKKKMSKTGSFVPFSTGRPVPPSGYQNHILIFSTSVFANQYSKNYGWHFLAEKKAEELGEEMNTVVKISSRNQPDLDLMGNRRFCW